MWFYSELSLQCLKGEAVMAKNQCLPDTQVTHYYGDVISDGWII